MASHYKVLHDLIRNHRWSWSDLNSLIPYELELEVAMIIAETKQSRNGQG